MAYRNKTLLNPHTRQDVRFLLTAKDTGGALLEMEATYHAHSREPAPHYHPRQAEDFTILSGEMSVRIEGQVKILKAGDTLHIPAKQVHSMWNNTDQDAVVNWKVRPALNTEHLLETANGLYNDGKFGKKSKPGLLQSALMANKFSGVFRLAQPPYAVQKIVFWLLTPFAYLAGYRPTYSKYLD